MPGNQNDYLFSWYLPKINYLTSWSESERGTIEEIYVVVPLVELSIDITKVISTLRGSDEDLPKA